MTSIQPIARRRLLTGLALGPVAAALPVSALANVSADAAIIALGKRHDDLTHDAHSLWSLADATLDRARQHCPAMPDALRWRLDDGARRQLTSVGGFMDARDVARWRNSVKTWSPASRDGERQRSRAREVVAAWYAHCAAVEAVNVSHGLRGLEERADALDRERFQVEQAIFDARAFTPAGWRLKAKIAAEVIGEDDASYEATCIRSLLADLRVAADSA